MARFADYEPLHHGAGPPDGLETRPATTADLFDLAAVRAARDGITEASATSAFERVLAQADGGSAFVLVAVIDGAIAGYGVAERLAPPSLPQGWYLGGVVVTPPMRRLGIGARLTRERLDWIAARARQAFYFANEGNRASIDLHARFGFRELARDIHVPGMTFSNGIGLLFGAELPPPG